MRIIFILFLLVSLPAISEEIVVEGVREKLRNVKLACDGQPAPEEKREPSPRIPDKSYSKEEIDRIHLVYSEQSKAKNKCLAKFISNYQSALYKYCVKYNASACIAGGCEHTVGYSVTTPVLEKALEYCEVKY